MKKKKSKKEKKGFVGISDGLVNSDKCGHCENCGALPTGMKWYFRGGTSWCENCLDAGGGE